MTDAHFTPVERVPPYGGYVRQAELPFASLHQAREDAARRAGLDAAQGLCAPLTPAERLDRVTILSVIPQCRAVGNGGYLCGADYRPKCIMRVKLSREVCGG
jgi:hypothetical protein